MQTAGKIWVGESPGKQETYKCPEEKKAGERWGKYDGVIKSWKQI